VTRDFNSIVNVLSGSYYFPCKRWLAVDEDDGQIARELVPVDEAFMRKGDDDDEESSTTLGLEQKGERITITNTISFIALVFFTNKEFAFVKLVHNIEH